MSLKNKVTYEDDNNISPYATLIVVFNCFFI